jgi:hypothetical protein
MTSKSKPFVLEIRSSRRQKVPLKPTQPAGPSALPGVKIPRSLLHLADLADKGGR